MNRRIITTYNKLNISIKQAIKSAYPEGVDDNLSRMKHIIKGYFFDGLVFNHGDTTYLIEWSAPKTQTSFDSFENDTDDYEAGDEGSDEIPEKSDFEDDGE